MHAVTDAAADAELDQGYRALPFTPVRYLRAGGRQRRAVLWWLAASALAIPSGLLTVLYQWTGMEVVVTGTSLHLSLYLPLVICTPLVLWYGYLWGAVPAYLSTFFVSLISGMDVRWALVFALANPLGLAMFTLVYRVTQLRTDLRNVPSVLGFVVVALLSNLASSSGSFVWAYTNEVGSHELYPIWQGWWLGNWLQAVLITAPMLWLMGRATSSWLADVRAPDPDNRHWQGDVLLAISGSLAVLLGYVAVTRHFSIEQLEQALQLSTDPDLVDSIGNAIDGMSYSLLVMVAVLSAVAYFGYRAVMFWNQRLLAANSALAERNLQLQELASVDALTGIANRRHVLAALDNLYARALRDGRPLCLLMIDADRFKKVNDTWGHLAGDAVLRDLAARLQLQLRGYDMLGRYGGEEFIVLLPDTQMDTALQVAERLRDQIARHPVATPAADITITISLGVAQLQAGDANPQALIHRADKALLAAKANGRNRVEADARQDPQRAQPV